MRIAVLCAVAACATPAPIHTFGDGALDRVTAMTFDREGNLYVAGWFENTIDAGCGPVRGNAYLDSLVVSYAPDGRCRWSIGYGGRSGDDANAIAVDDNGHVWVAGSFMFDVDVGAFHLHDQGVGDIVLVELAAATGAVENAVVLATPGADEATALALDAKGEPVVCGVFDQQLFLAALGTRGDIRWQHTLAADNFVYACSGIAIDETGTIVVAHDAIDLVAHTCAAQVDSFSAGGVHGFTFPAAGCASGIAYGPGGAMYIASDSGITALAHDGSLTWDLPTPAVAALAVTGDTIDGAGNMIEQLGLDGQFRHTDALDPNATAASLAAGPDGELAIGGQFQYRMDFNGQHVESMSTAMACGASAQESSVMRIPHVLKRDDPDRTKVELLDPMIGGVIAGDTDRAQDRIGRVRRDLSRVRLRRRSRPSPSRCCIRGSRRDGRSSRGSPRRRRAVEAAQPAHGHARTRSARRGRHAVHRDGAARWRELLRHFRELGPAGVAAHGADRAGRSELRSAKRTRSASSIAISSRRTFTSSGAIDFVKVLDFGIAKIVQGGELDERRPDARRSDDRHVRLHAAGADGRRRAVTRRATSSRSASSCTR